LDTGSDSKPLSRTSPRERNLVPTDMARLQRRLEAEHFVHAPR
jgi:hypothetical protein